MAQTEAQIYAKLVAESAPSQMKDPGYVQSIKAEAHMTASAQPSIPIVKTQDTAAVKVINENPTADTAAAINAKYTQYQVQLANDLSTGKINQAQFQNEFEKLRAQQNASLAQAAKKQTLSAAEKAKLAKKDSLALAPGETLIEPNATASEVAHTEATTAESIACVSWLHFWP
jgi:hypothetical protein